MKTTTDFETEPAVRPTATEQAFGYLFVCLLILVAVVLIRIRGDEAPLVLTALAAIGSMSWLWAFVRTIQAWREPEVRQLPLGGALCLFALAVVGAGTLIVLNARP